MTTPPRLRPLRREELDAEQLALWDELTTARSGDDHTDDAGGLVGPFNAFVHAAAVWRRLLPGGAFLRTGTSVDPRLLELAICTVAEHWGADFAVWQHTPMAVDAGVAPAALDGLRNGQVPASLRDDERLVHDLTRQLLQHHAVDDATYAAVVDLLGERGTVELATVVGFYGLISQLLVLFQVPLPPRSER